MPEGIETIKVEHPDYGFMVVNGIEVKQGQTTEDIEIVLIKGGAIEGYVYDELDNRRANMLLIFQDKSGYSGKAYRIAGQLGKVVTDSNGYYHLAGLPEQTCHIILGNEWQHLGVVRQTAMPINGKITRLDFGGGNSITGQIILNDEPLANTKIQIGDNWNRMFTSNAMTASDGSFEFRGTPVGTRKIYYNSPILHKWIKLVEIDVQDEDMDLGTLSLETGKVLIYISSEDVNELIEDYSVYLQHGVEWWDERAGYASKPVHDNEPYVISEVVPGKYTVVIRLDSYEFRETIDFAKDQKEFKVMLKIPKGTATVSGQIISDSTKPIMILYRSDKKISTFFGRNSTYRIEHLPAGEYSIEYRDIMYKNQDSEPLVTFNLSEGENKTIDLDTKQ